MNLEVPCVSHQAIMSRSRLAETRAVCSVCLGRSRLLAMEDLRDVGRRNTSCGHQ